MRRLEGEVALSTFAGEEYTSRVQTRNEVAHGMKEQMRMEIGIADSDGYLGALARRCLPKRPDFEPRATARRQPSDSPD